MNHKMIRYVLGWLLVFEAIFLAIPFITALIYKEDAAVWFFLCALLCLALGFLCKRRPKDTTLNAKDGFVIVALSWIVLSIFGSLPFIMTGVTSSYIDALFETVSGFTTTGSSIFSSVEDLEMAYALTVHKSQGSEWSAVIIPVCPFPPMLMTRNLLYTAVTRGKKLVILVGNLQSVSTMVNNNKLQLRYSSLEKRLRESVKNA